MTENIFEQALQRTSASLIDSLFDTSGGYVQDGRNGPEYWIKNPVRGDGKVGSFSINLTDGTCYDFATDEGSNIIKLLADMRGISELEAAEEITGESSTISKTETVRPTPKKSRPASVWPIPESRENMLSVSEAVKADWAVEKFGQPEKIYQYKDVSGGWRFVTVRYVKADGSKNVIPYYYTGNRWQAGRPEDQAPYCLYQEQRLSPKDKKPIVIVEGEKCAYPDDDKYAIVSWIGGTSNVDKTDWTIIREVASDENRLTYIWPDADCQTEKNTGAILPENKQPGMKAASEIKKLIPSAVILDPYKIRPIEMLSKSWDIADAREEGLSVDDCINRMLPPEPKKEKEVPEAEIEGRAVKLKPRNVYEAFIDFLYPDGSLEQINGMFWSYDPAVHFWKKSVYKDIECNFQTWFFDSGLHDASEKVCKPTTFANDTITYLKRHSTGYIGGNPFKHSAISPYIHHADGCIHLTDEQLKFTTRDEQPEGYFKKLYPIMCFDYGITEDYYHKFNIERDAPCLRYYVDELVPARLKRLKDTGSDEERKYYEKELRRTRQYISQIFAYCLSPIKKNPAAFILTGKGDTGKTFFTDLIKELVGSEFVVERSIEMMDEKKNKNYAYDLWGSKVYIEPDASANVVLSDDILKKICGHIKGATIEQKYETAQKGVDLSIAAFIVSNYKINFGSKTEGVDRRVHFIPYKDRLKRKDIFLMDKITGKKDKGHEAGIFEGQRFDERPGMLAYALDGWKLFIENDFEFIVPDWCQSAKDTWLIESSTISHYLHEIYFKVERSETIGRKQLYDDYKNWCEEEERKPYGKKGFYDEIRDHDKCAEIHSQGGDFFKINIKDEEDGEDDF